MSKIIANRLKSTLPNLIGRGQCGFIASRNSLNDIIVVQEVTHSIERHLDGSPKMLIKIDMVKKQKKLIIQYVRMPFFSLL